MPRTEEQNKEIRESKIELIKKSALELFANEGFHNTSILQIAKKANVSKGLLYNYFDSKDDLLRSIVKEQIDKMWKNFDPNKDGILTEEEFIHYINFSFQIVENNLEFWRLFSVIALKPSVQKIFVHDADDKAVYMIKLLTEFFKKHNCEDPEAEIFFFTSLIKGAIIQYIGSPFYFPIEKVKAKIIKHYTEKLNFKIQKK